MEIVFLGTPQFAVSTLEGIVAAGHRIAAVYTQPDRPKGRGQQTAHSPVKESALKFGLTVRQPERVRRPEIVEELRALNSDVMVVVGYGQIIPQAIIDLPRFGILNVHASLLPKYRGAAPIQWAIANGETHTGVTIMQIDAGLDTGPTISAEETGIGPEETAPELSERLAALWQMAHLSLASWADRVVIAPREVRHPANECAVDRRERVELLGAGDRIAGAVMPPTRGQHERVIGVGQRVQWIERQRLTKAFFGLAPIP